MLSLDEFKFALTEGHQGPHWKNAYVDRVGNYWIQGNGGLGTTIFQRLDTDHPFVGYIVELLKASLLEQQDFEYQYEAGGEELAQLMHIADTKLYKQLTSKESKEAADKLFEASPKELGDSFSDDPL